ncbi:MAG: glycosyltransferase family 39 protein [Chloroflexi bacterium]|nr:glycosyltransferase family 39 protein [Chloroflexota bacterium]
MPRRLLYLLLCLQVLTHLFWLSPAAHSGQVAIPWMMNRGLTLFGEIWEQHAPGSSLLAAAAQSLFRIDPGLLVKLLNIGLVLALTVLVYLLARQLAGGGWAGLLGAAVFAWWEPVYGNVLLYFETLLALCVAAALLVFLRAGERPSLRRIALVGLLMGAATLFKQHAWLAVGILGLWLLLIERRRQSALVYAGAALALPLLQWVALWSAGLLEGYLFWNWTFNLSGAMDGVPLDGDLFRKLLLTNALVFPFIVIAWRDNRKQLVLVALWLAGLTLLYPRAGENHAMAHLPLAAVMSGVVLAKLPAHLGDRRLWDGARAILAGLLVAGGIGWLWTGAVSYIPTPLGPGAILAYDEFRELASQLSERAEPHDTLFVLPETDSTPQLHPLTGMLPPGVWVKGWHWYFKPAHVLEELTAGWEANPPTWIVVFPSLTAAGEPGIKTLLDIVAARYRPAFESAEIFDHGRALVYHLNSANE